METLPDEALIKEILGRLTVQQILERCTTEQRFARICQSNELWSLLTIRDFPLRASFQACNVVPWRQYYFDVLRSPILPIYFYEDPID